MPLIFGQPNEDIVFRYSLAKESSTIKSIEDGKEVERVRHYVHLFTMWNVDKSMINAPCLELKSENAVD